MFLHQYAFPIRGPYWEIGSYSYFHADLLLRAYAEGERITIGRYCSIADRVKILTGGMRRTDRASLYIVDEGQYTTTSDTRIGNDVWIGMGAVILGGANVGDGAVIASGAVVFHDVPPFAIAAGNPARAIRYRFSKPVIERLQRIAWWNWPMSRVVDNQLWFGRPVHEFIDHFDPQE